MTRYGLVVVDAQRAFTDPTCLLGRLHGAAQFTRIRSTVGRLSEFASQHEGPKIWVRAHYEPGQFTAGALDGPLAALCSDHSGIDCEWDAQLVPPADATIVTKATVDAGSSPAFVDATEAMIGHVDELLVTGFWLTACVAATALSCAERLHDRLPVMVPLSLSATRLGLYMPDDDHSTDVDVALGLERLRNAGVNVCDTP